MSHREIDALTGTETTGHEWDGIRELDTPMPRWWLWTFYATVVFALIYGIFYPALPLPGGPSKGTLGWQSRHEVGTEMQVAAQAQSVFRDQIAQSSLQKILDDPALFQFASSAGRSAFTVNCSQCHGAGAAGSPGYPNLQDDEWIWGGSLDEIYHTISYGVRNGETKAHDSLMPAFGKDQLLQRKQITDVSAYVMTLAGAPPSFGDAAAGAEIYGQMCVSCHGEQGQGVKQFGGPKLANPIWLYGNTQSDITTQIHNPKHGVMPAWGPRLGDEVVKELTVYVYALGGGGR